MLWFMIGQFIQVIMDVLTLHLIADRDKDLEVLVLRQQIRILERRLGKQVRPSRVEKLLLALSALQIKVRVGQQRFKNSILLFKPATILKWHRDLVKRKWTFQRREKVGRPRIDEELEVLIVLWGPIGPSSINTGRWSL